VVEKRKLKVENLGRKLKVSKDRSREIPSYLLK
jgi:hypothetical protein